MDLQPGLFAALSALSAIVSAGVAYVAWRRRTVAGALALALLMASVFIWSACYSLHWTQSDLALSRFWLNGTLLGAVIAPTALFILAAGLTGHAHWPRSYRWLFLVEPFLTLLLFVTDPLHHLFTAGQVSPSPHLIAGGGPWLWANFLYSYSLVLISVFWTGQSWRGANSPYREQLQILLLGTLLPAASSLVVLFFPSLLGEVDATSFVFAVTGLLFAWGLFRYGLFDSAPIARDALVDNLSDGVLVVDAHDRITDLNRQAQQMLHLPGERVVGQPLAWALAGYPELIAPITRRSSQEILLHGDSLRYIDCKVAPLYDRQQRENGHMLVLHDITARKQMEELLREQGSMAEALRDTARALNSTLDLERILERILENVGRVIPHDAANIALIQEEGIARCVRAHGYAERGLEFLPAAKMQVLDMVGFRRMLETGEPMIVPDTALEPGWITLSHAGWVRSYAGMPIRLRGQVIGFINLDSAIPCFFRAAHVDPLRAFADQVAIAVENARLYEETHRRAEALSLLLDVGLTISANLNMDQILRRLLDECLRILPIDSFYVAIYNEQTDILSHALFYDHGEYRSFSSRKVHPTESLSGEVIDRRQTIYVRDAMNSEAMRRHHIVHAGGQPARSYVGVPLVARDQIVGVISMQNYEPNAYNEEQIHLLETIATQAAVTVENARLYAEVQNELAERNQEITARVQAESALREANEQLKVQLARVQALEEELREQAIRDPLTGLYNRRFLHESLDRELARALREGELVSVIMLDIDHFKRINDSYLHDGGDRMLVALAAMLEKGTRKGDIPCRYGGEEFLIVLPCASSEVAFRRAEEWRKIFQGMQIDYQGHQLQATISLGVATFPIHAVTGEEIVRSADEALYVAKKSGRNRTVIFTL